MCIRDSLTRANPASGLSFADALQQLADGWPGFQAQLAHQIVAVQNARWGNSLLTSLPVIFEQEAGHVQRGSPCSLRESRTISAAQVGQAQQHKVDSGVACIAEESV